jgi:hypothetical protein
MAVDMLVVVATTASTAKPAAGFWVDFYGEKACRRLKKSLRDNSLCAAGAQVRACKWLLRLQGVRSKLLQGHPREVNKTSPGRFS